MSALGITVTACGTSRSGVGVLVLALMVGASPDACPFTSMDCVNPATRRTNSTSAAPDAWTLTRRDSSTKPGELMVTRYAPGSSGSSNLPSASDTEVVAAPPDSAMAVTCAAVTAALIGSTTRPRNIVVCAEATAEVMRTRTNTDVRLSLRVTSRTLYPTVSVRQDQIGRSSPRDSGVGPR